MVMVPGGVLIIFLGGGVPPGPENPYPISDQNIWFSVPYFRPDSQNVYPISDPVMCGNFSNSQWIYGVRDFVVPQTMFAVFFFMINVSNTRYSKNGIPDQTDRIYTLFQTEMAKSIPYFRLEMLENGTLWGDTYLYGLYMGVTPPSPPPPGVMVYHQISCLYSHEDNTTLQTEPLSKASRLCCPCKDALCANFIPFFKLLEIHRN